MRIALAVGTLAVGGTETQLCRLAVELQARGHAVKVLALFSGGPLEDQLQAASVPFDILGFPGFVYRDAERGFVPMQLIGGVLSVFRFWSALWRFHPDVCHAFLPWAYMLAMPGAALGRVPARVAGRRSLPSTLGLRRRELLLQRLSVATAHAIVANSEAVRLDAERTEGIDPAKLHVIRNGSDLSDVVADVGAEPPVGLMVANLIAYKGHDDLITAVAAMRQPVLIRLVGDGPERSRLEERVRLEGLGRVLEFEGPVRGAGALFSSVQFGVLASHEEGMPNAVIEAMAHGVPVVATRVGGVPELIEHEVNGLLVPPHDPAALGSAIARIAGDPALRVRLGAAARERAAALSWSRCVDAHLALYEELLSRRAGSTPRALAQVGT